MKIQARARYVPRGIHNDLKQRGRGALGHARPLRRLGVSSLDASAGDQHSPGGSE